MEEKIYGLYTRGYDSQKIAEMDNWELFLEYYSITYLAWHIKHTAYKDFSNDWISKEEYNSMMEELDRLQYNIEYLLYTISKRNDIEVNEPEAGKHISPNPEVFMKWYRFYADHFIHKMPDSTWKEFKRKHWDGADVSEYLPKGDWRE